MRRRRQPRTSSMAIVNAVVECGTGHAETGKECERCPHRASQRRKTSALAPFVKSTTMARTEARRLSIGDLEKLVASLGKTLASEKTKQEKKQSQERTATIKKVNALLAENGLQPNDLKKTAAKPKPKPKAKAKSDAKTTVEAKAKGTVKTKANSKAKSAGQTVANTTRVAAKKSAKRKTVPPGYRLNA